jgi:hypothetical protein
MVEKQANINNQSNELTKLTKEYDELIAIKARIATSSGSNLDTQIKKIAEKYDRANIMSAVLFSDYTK